MTGTATGGGLTRRTVLRRAAGAGALAALGPLAGCGGGEGGATVGWQSIASYSVSGTDPARVKYLQDGVAQWRERHPRWQARNIVAPQDVTTMMARLLQQAPFGRAPDASMIDAYLLPRFYDFVQPLDGALGDLGVTADDWFPFARTVMRAPDGSVRGMQFTSDARVLWYRRDLIDRPPASWDEVLDVGRDLTREGYVGYLFPAGRDEGAVITSLYPYFWALGGELVDPSGRPSFGEGENRRRMLECLRFVSRCVDSGITPRRVTAYGAETDLNGEIASGRTAMFLGANFQVGTLKEILGEEEFVRQWAVAPIPSQSGRDHATTAGGWVWALFTPDREKQRALIDLLGRLFLSPQGMAGWTTIGGYLPPRPAVIDRPDFEGDEYTAAFEEQVRRYARVRPSAQSYLSISSALQAALSVVVSGARSPEDALSDAAETVRQ